MRDLFLPKTFHDYLEASGRYSHSVAEMMQLADTREHKAFLACYERTKILRADVEKARAAHMKHSANSLGQRPNEINAICSGSPS